MTCFSGDDSLLIGGDIDYDRNQICADLFNLESKFFRSYKYYYFSSKFLLVVDGKFLLVPDPVKLITKLGRHDLVNWEHAKEYAISLKDLTSVFSDSKINHALTLAINERYDLSRSSYGMVFSALRYFTSDPDVFCNNLYYSLPGDRLCTDPSFTADFGLICCRIIINLLYAIVMEFQADLASKFTRKCIEIQLKMADSLKPFTTKVYVFDSVDFFKNAEEHIYDGTRFRVRDGKYALLSGTAQSVFSDQNEYQQFCVLETLRDSLGVFRNI